MNLRHWFPGIVLIATSLVRADSGTPHAFVREVVPVLTKAGCNSGACHGSFQGRGGLRLSLLGFDPGADHDALTKEARGRRVSAAAPEQSLMLRKAAGLMPHGGGLRLPPRSASYEIVRNWLQHGAPGVGDHAPRVTRLQVDPVELTLNPQSSSNPLVVRAVWSDGVVQDAAAWALIDSRDNEVAQIADDGRIVAGKPGRTAITVRFLGQAASVIVTVPFDTAPDAAAFATFAPRNFIDEHVLAEWQKVGLPPAAECDDATFLRRVSLDLIGTLPTPDEVRSFLASHDPRNRAKLIDALLNRPEYVDYWALKWSDLLRAHRRALGEKGLVSFQNWLRSRLRENRSAQVLARELLTAQGSLYANGPVGYYFVDQTPQDLAETTAQIFLGVRLQCARCHHHPFEAWGQDDYFGLAAFFANVQRKDTKEGGRFGGAQSIFVQPGPSSLPHPATGQGVRPRVLGSAEVAGEAGDSRPRLAEWLTSPGNPYFAKNLVNRYWGYLLGRGLVEPLDDLRATNPASHPALLDALADDFTRHGFDFRHLLRTICNSRAYQLASNLNPDRDPGGMFYSFYLPRRLPAEVLLDAINQAAAVAEGFPNLPPGTRAVALSDPTIASYFLDTFGRPNRSGTCECERGSRGDLSQSLHLANGESIHKKITAANGRLARLRTEKKTDDEISDELYLATLSRRPTEVERATIRRHVSAAAAARAEVFEDLLWTLLNCAEFSFQH